MSIYCSASIASGATLRCWTNIVCTYVHKLGVQSFNMKIIVNISTLRWSMMKIRSFSHFVHNNVKIIAKMDDF